MRDIQAERAEIDAIIDGKTLCDAFHDTVERLGDADALRYKDDAGEWRAYNWDEYRDRVRSVALGLRSIGFEPGSFAVIMMRNRPEHVISDLGVVHSGGTPVSLYNTLSPEQVSYIANHCEARIAIVEDLGFYEKFLKIRSELPNIERVVLLNGSEDADPSWTMSWGDLVESGRAVHEANPDAFDQMWRAVKPEDPLTLVYTSGTTGPPKGVVDTHRTVLWDIASYRTFWAAGPEHSVISYLPLAHAADRLLTYWLGVVSGHVVSYCPDIAQILPTLLEVRPTTFGAVPRVWEKMYAGLNAAIAREPDEQRKGMATMAIETGREVVAHEQKGVPIPEELAQRHAMFQPVYAAIREKLGLDRVELTVTGAAPTPPEIMEFFHAIGIPIAELWGMSELAVVATVNPLDRIKIGTIGVPLPGVEARIAGDGELMVRGGLVMQGYYKDAEKTAETIDADGWLATGDVAEVDEDGYLRIVDRKKELIITAGGKNISPANLESLLKQHPLIGQACVIGDNRPYLSALIVLDGEVAPAWAAQQGIDASTIAELSTNPAVRSEIENAVASVNQRVSRVENVRRHAILPTEWTAESEELTPTLKLKRRVIADAYADVIEGLYQG